MRIEKIEIIGFKSFADRTVFNLHPGITCIVGPNGCGKSNVVDSFKWVLGEQSAKSLRGDKMEEVIFNGSQSKKPKGMSEVTLSVMGLGGSGNGDSDALSVTRRLYRSGDSEYMLNRDVCRLRDIRDIFLDTGLEVKSYSILEQDRISAVLNAKPEDRRFLIEEVAGVVKYKVRRAEALSKLSSSRLNLQRVKDVIAEVKRQINSLDRQVKKAEKYKRLMEELRSIDLRLAKRDYGLFRESLERAVSEHAALREKDASLRAEISLADSEIESGRLALVDREKALDALMLELRAVEKDLAETDRGAAVLKADRENLKEYLLRLKVQEEETREKIGECGTKRGEIEGLKAGLAAEVEALKEELRLKNESLGIKEDELLEREGLIDLKRKEAFDVSEELSHQRNELRMQAAFLENLKKSEDSASVESSEVKTAIEEADAALRAAEEEKAKRHEDAALLQSKKEAGELEISSRKEGLEALKASLSGAREELASHSSKIESLKEMISGGEPAGDIKPLATVSEAIDVPAEYEKAIENALREAVNGFIMPSIDEVRAAAGLIREKESGRAAVISAHPLRAVVERGLPPGVIGRASELIRVRDEYSGLLRNLLGNVVVVSDLKTALEAEDTGFTYVTLDGDVVEPSGAVIAGKGRGILRIKRQIRELEAAESGIKSRIASLQAEIDSGIEALLRAEGSLRALSAEMLDNEKELHELGVRAGGYKEEGARLGRKLENIKIEIDRASAEREELLRAISEREGALKGIEERKGLVEAEIAGLQSGLQSERAVYEEQRDKTVDIRLSLNSCRERSEAMDKEYAGLERLGFELADKLRFIGDESSATGSKITRKEEEIAAAEEALKVHVLRAGEVGGKISAERDAIAGEAAVVQAAEDRLKGLRSEIEPVLQRISELEVMRAEDRLRMDNLAGNIKTNYDVDIETLDALDAGPPAPDDEERLAAVRGRIQELGPVSLGSIEEYEELRTRYEFLTKQEGDIEQSIAELEVAISKINSTTRKRLSEAYEALNSKFGEIFVSLFGGGRAELRLTDENNILETGIDIAVQPPGKRLQNINLLSGGEKTLTALSLLFASFLIKPTPLCILDEADAALDESNTEKFSKMLKELSKDTQFVVVTHNKVTMETADYIYGITMEEAGVSKAISLQLVDAKGL